jgi:hypothetical protein
MNILYNTNGENVIGTMMEIVQYILCDHAASPVTREQTICQ